MGANQPDYTGAGGVPGYTLAPVDVGTPALPEPVSSGSQTPGFADAITYATGGALDLTQHAAEIAPLDQLSAQRIARYAGLPPPNAPMADLSGSMPDVLPLGTVPPDVRYHYGEALKNGVTTDPQDFAEQLAGAAWATATDGVADANHDSNAAQITNGAKALAAALPPQDDLDAYAGYIAHKVYATTDPTIVNGISDNLLDAWRDTGMDPGAIMQRANTDPDLMSRLANPQPIPPQQSPHFPTMEELSTPGRDAISDPLGTMGTAATGKNPLLPDCLQGAITQLTGPDILTQQQEYDKKDAELAAQGVSLADRVAQLGVGPVAQSFGVANLEETAPAIISHGFSALFQTLGAGSDLAANAKTIFNRNAGRAKNTQSIVGDLLEEFRPQVNKLIPEHDQFSTDMAAYAEARTAAKERFVMAGGKPDDFTYALDPPPLSAIQTIIDHVEARPGGGRVAEGSDLFPLVQRLQDVYAGLRGEIERNFDIDSFIENYYRHAYSDPAAYDRAFGRRGDASALNFRSIPYQFDAMVRGLKPKFLDPLDNTFRYAQGMLDYIGAEKNLRELESVGQMAWGRREPIAGWVKLNGVERRPQQPEIDVEARERQQPLTDDYHRDIPFANQIAAEAHPTVLKGLETNLPANTSSGIPATPGASPTFLGGPEPAPGAQGLPRVQAPPRRQLPDKEFAWAHPSTARIYNNMVGAGFNGWGSFGKGAGTILDKMRVAGNFSTATHFMLAGGHLMNMGWEAMTSGMAHGMGEIAQGEIARGLMDMGFSATLVPRVIRSWNEAKAFEKILLDKAGPLEGMNARLRQLYIDTNARAFGRGSEMSVGQSANLYKAWQQGGLALRAKQLYGEANHPFLESLHLGPISRAVSAGAQLAGDLVTTASAPLFDKLVPRLKMAAWLNETAMWLRSHPNASEEEALARANQNADSMDDRFGEMNQDRIYLPREMKQIMNATLLSTGWWYGTMRAFGRGAADLVTLKNTTRSRWLLSSALTSTIISSIYQMFATGTRPSSFKDIMLPRNGDTLQSGEPGRSQYLSPWKEFFDAYSAAFGVVHSADVPTAAKDVLLNYFGNKTNPGLHAMINYLTASEGKAWQSQVLSALTPLSIFQTYGGRTNTIGPVASYLSFRPGPRSITDPEALANILNRHAAGLIYQEQLRAYRQDQQLANPTLPKPDRLAIYQNFGIEMAPHVSRGSGHTNTFIDTPSRRRRGNSNTFR